MKKRVLGAVAGCLFLTFNATAATITDQSFSGTGLSNAINACCSYIAQTFTAGVTADLTSVSAEIVHNDDLTLAIYNTGVSGAPETTPLSSLTVSGSGTTLLSEIYSFTSPVSIIAGETYALVASIANGAGGAWNGANSNGYLGGSIWGTSDVFDWRLHYSTYDLNFITYVDSASIVPTTVPVPATAWLLGSALMGLAGWTRRKT